MILIHSIGNCIQNSSGVFILAQRPSQQNYMYILYSKEEIINDHRFYLEPQKLYNILKEAKGT